jgi:hypothetical protein
MNQIVLHMTKNNARELRSLKTQRRKDAKRREKNSSFPFFFFAPLRLCVFSERLANERYVLTSPRKLEAPHP